MTTLTSRPFVADRIAKLPPYLFVEIDRLKQEAIVAGKDVIDFGIGDPDRPTPRFIVDELTSAVRNPATHRYASSVGSIELRCAAADFMRERFGVSVDPRSEVLVVLGTKEAIGHLPTAVINAGDVVLAPEPGYPVYWSGTLFAGGTVHAMPLREENGWLPVLEDVPEAVRLKARLMYLNYPNNPTGAAADLGFFERAVAYAREHDLLIAHDAAYSEVFYEQAPHSILEVPGAKECCIEFHSLSKTYNMTGWRVGFVVGHAGVLAALAAVKSNVDSGVFIAVQQAAIRALTNYRHPDIAGQRALYRRRRDALLEGLRACGWQVTPPQGAFYVWARCPGGQDSMAASARVLKEAAVVCVPGVGFGPCGEGYVRFALTVDERRIAEATQRIAGIRW